MAVLGWGIKMSGLLANMILVDCWEYKHWFM